MADQTIPFDINLDFSLKTLFSPEFGIKDLDLLETVQTGVFGRTRLVRSLKDRHFYTLKIMKKARIVKQGQLSHVKNEIQILSRIRCPFVIELRAVFQDENSLYLLCDYLSGGEVYSHLRRSHHFDLPVYQFITVEIICAFYHLHKMQIIYRDLKPENVLFNKLGHIVLTELSLAKLIFSSTGTAAGTATGAGQSGQSGARTFTLCGTPEYVSPEMIIGQGYGFSIDWWCLGIFLHEMVIGFPPYFGKNPFTVYRKVLGGQLPYLQQAGDHVPPATKQLIKGLLTVDRLQRLGCSSFDILKNHAFFKGIDWYSAFRQLIVPPLIPTILSEGDSSNFDFYPEETLEEPANLSSLERNLFQSIDDILDRPKQAL